VGHTRGNGVRRGPVRYTIRSPDAIFISVQRWPEAAVKREFAVSDLQNALKLEELRQKELFDRLTKEEGARVLRVGMGDGSHTASGLLREEVEAARRDKWEKIIDGYVQIRRELAANFPELCEGSALDDFQESVSALIERAFHIPPSGGPFPVRADSVPMERRYNNRELKERLQNKVEILRHEFALKLHKPGAPPSVTVNTGGGPALVNLGQIRGDVQQVVGSLNAAGQIELATFLDCLVAEIEALAELGPDRSTYLEQVRFIAQQAIEPQSTRQPSIVRAVFDSLRARLQDFANVAQILTLAGPAVAHHFGLNWPS
jgi:hypothetical protein